MQIFDDKKKRIGTLSGFKDRSITTTLDSGDKELSFDYPAAGAMVDLLKEEYYIRTKTDEFVIKAVEKGEQFNKYTAVLNVEELEGAAFPYGFESQEQTIKACLEFAFEGTGWHVGTCTVTKKRTINEEESVTAWDVLQKSISTYRCECIIDSINKVVNIYERIGSDKGCYFMEGLNLRKLTLKSDTYEFYTRIYPIGKDGITPEWLTGKDYIDNFQYSSKVKAYVWKDERYTNTTSLIEDATAKIEEMSRPYKAFTAEVVDLARASEKYKEILSYSIGDTVTLVSKKTQTKEKQRIVKITEYPETPERNTVEISNARKTFAEIQQEETKSATQEAVSISNRTTKKILENYSTTEDIETKITASKEAVELGVMHTLESYYDKTETDALIDVSKGEIELNVSQTYQTKAAMGNYSTTKETQSLIDIAIDGVELSVSETLESYATTSEMNAAIKLKTDAITSEVNKKVNENEFGTLITQNAYNVRLAFNKNSNYIQFDYYGMTLYNGTINDNQKRTVFDYNGEHFYRDGYYVGKIGTNNMVGDTSKRGLVFDLESTGAYMTWANEDAASETTYTMKWSYCSQQCGGYEANMLHAGADINMHFFKLRNVSFEDGSISGTLVFKQPLGVDSEGKLTSWSTAKLEFKRGILVSGSWSDG